MQQKPTNNSNPNQFDLLKRDYTPNIEHEIQCLDNIISRIQKSCKKIELLVEEGDYHFGILN